MKWGWDLGRGLAPSPVITYYFKINFDIFAVEIVMAIFKVAVCASLIMMSA